MPRPRPAGGGINWFENNGPNQVNHAVRLVCQDDLGKQAVQAKLKKVAMKNVKEAQEKAMSFKDGVLDLRCAFAKSPGGRFDIVEIKKCLEQSL